MLETYALEKQPRDVGSDTWVMDSLLEAGIQPEVLLRILDDMYWRNEIPFQGRAQLRLIRDFLFVAEKWFYASLKSGRYGMKGAGFKAQEVVEMLEMYARNGLEMGPEKERLQKLVGEVKKKMLI